MFVTPPKNTVCVVVDNQSKDLVVFQIFSTVRMVLITWKQASWHQSFVLPKEKPIASLIGTKFCFVTGASWFPFSFFALTSALSRLMFVEPVCFVICTIKIFRKSLNECLRSLSPRVKRELCLSTETLWDAWPGVGVEVGSGVGKGPQKAWVH